MMTFKLSKLAVSCLMLMVALVWGKQNINPVSLQYPVEAHHSLHPPLDHSQVYWIIGGSTVMTKKYLRLTPATQGRQGWVWNEYPVEAENFEVEVKFEVSSHPHFGGDGFGLWFVENINESNQYTDPEAINGPLFGMNRNFRGVGVIFDTYDNDGKRNNPSIYVVHNERGPFTFSHEQDFENDMVKTTPRDIDSTHDAYKCVADIRNINRSARALVKFLNQVLYVYVDTEDGQGWRFCLAVAIDRGHDDPLRNSLRGTHMAFTAATGQVADNMDVIEVTTRYLKSTDTVSELAELESLASGSMSGRVGGMISFVTAILSIGLCVFTLFELQEYRTMVGNHIDAVAVTYRMNRHTYQQFYAHVVLCGLLLVSGQWFVLIVNLPLAIIRYLLHSKGALLLSPALVTRMGSTGSGLLGLSPETRFYIATGVLGVSSLAYVYQFLFGY